MLLVASNLISNQRLQDIDVIRQLIQCNRHAGDYTTNTGTARYKTLEKCKRSCGCSRITS
jgi:hypothetical protein